MSILSIPGPQHGRKPKYDFASLSIPGEFIFIETQKPHIVCDAAYKWAKKNGVRAVTRRCDGGIRVYHGGVV